MSTATLPETTQRRLTPREREVVDLVTIGLTNKEIGARLHISTETVKEHVQQALKKTKSRNRAHMATWTTREVLRSSGGIMGRFAPLVKLLRKLEAM